MANWTVDLYTTANAILPGNTLNQDLTSPFPIVVDPEGPFVQHVVQYDASLHKYDRSPIVKATVKEPGTVTLLSVIQCTDGHFKTTGYACMKKSMQGHWLIAPVYADNYKSAFALIFGLLSDLDDSQRREGVVAKLTSSNSEAAKLFLQFGMKKSQYQLRRLFTKRVFEIPESKIFALQSSVFCTE
ncbi:uncharacterized protein LOC118182115 [Stegodyphus dumicola]|uniref:uncharacterized protein LOC118182115 n=1 Tax=Stegodyphus dumicola TaxID=202533 RepID=UPI0015AB9BE8|nr:uncharacterized protein LOC118182115 [Stegodyphus dumicola]